MFQNIYIDSRIENSLLIVEFCEKLKNISIFNAAMEKIDCPLIQVKELNCGRCQHTLDASKLIPWSPDTPVLYYVQTDFGRIRFGHSELKTFPNTNILQHNAHPCFLRGYIRGIVAHDHPNMTGGSTKDAAVKNIRQAKKYGFNLVRFHSTIPSTEFVETADEEGLFIHLEIGFNYTYDNTGEKKLAIDNHAWEETIKLYRNHPSIAIFCIGNEMHQAGHFPEVKCLYNKARKLAPSKLIMDNAGWGEFDRQSADIFAQHIAYFFPFKQHQDMFNSDAPWRMNGSVYDEKLEASTETASFKANIRRWTDPIRPTLAHEALHYIDIPDYQKLNKKFEDFSHKVGKDYLKKYAIKKPRYLTEIPKLLKRKGLEAKIPDYIAGSQQFKMTAIKTYLEALRFSKLCGFEMLQFADCLKYENKNGIVDFFDDDKFIPAEWMRSLNSDAVLLAKFENEVFYYDEEIKVDISISNYLAHPQVTGDILVKVKSADREDEVYHGKNISLAGGLQKLAEINLNFNPEKKAVIYELCAVFTFGDIEITNSWKFWLYPRVKIQILPDMELQNIQLKDFIYSKAPKNINSDIIVTDLFNDKVYKHLEQGKNVILFYHRDTPGEQYYLPGALERFKPCIWDRGSNLGGIIYSDTLRKTFQGGKYFDLNMYSLLEAGYKICLDDFPCSVEEHVGGIDKPVRDRMKGLMSNIKDFLDENTLRNFSHLFSIKIGKGNLIVSTFNVNDTESPVVATFLATLLNNINEFKTKKSISLVEFKKYIQEQAAKGIRREDIMNHFWEEDNKLVEDTLFWEESGIDLRKLETEGNTDNKKI